MLKKWVGIIENPQEEFNKIDADGGGTISFDEFCDWAITKNLDIDDKENNADLPLEDELIPTEEDGTLEDEEDENSNDEN